MSDDARTMPDDLRGRSCLRIGISGVTEARTRYADALSFLSPLQIVALADADIRAARSWARALPDHPAVFPALAAMLEGAQNLDAIVIVAPREDRAGLIALSTAAGYPALCDLPVAPELRQTEALFAEARRRGVWLFPSLSRRFDPLYSEAFHRVDMDQIGKLRQIRCDWTFAASDSPRQECAVEWADRLVEAAYHSADLGCKWLGSALSVSADLGPKEEDLPSPSPRRRSAAPERSATILVTHERGQCIHRFSQSRSIYPEERYVFTGAEGNIELVAAAGLTQTTAGAPSLVRHRSGRRPEPLIVAPAGNETERIVRMLSHFADCVLTGMPPSIGAEEARAAAEIVEAASTSSRENAKISLPIASG